jgi:NAD(P)-dependent dehydrogenase (short-subunit alcohol dehydrogenase family)
VKQPLNRSNQSDLFLPDQADGPATIIGAGGIGSAAAIILAKMGAPLTILDFDTVQEHNLASQFYRNRDAARNPPVLKTEALREIIEDFSDAQPVMVPERYVDQPLSGLVIAAVDTMEARSLIWQQVRGNVDVDLLIDSRMGGHFGELICVRPCDPDHVAAYESKLFPDSRAAPEPCGARAISYNTFAIGAFIASLARNWWVERSAPWCFRFDLKHLNFLTELKPPSAP